MKSKDISQEYSVTHIAFYALVVLSDWIFWQSAHVRVQVGPENSMENPLVWLCASGHYSLLFWSIFKV